MCSSLLIFLFENVAVYSKPPDWFNKLLKFEVSKPRF